MLAKEITEAHTATVAGTILAVHGLMGSSETLRSVACSWAERGWRTIAVDLPGHGSTPALRSGSRRDGDRMAEEIADVAEGVSGPLVLFGHSAGGSVVVAAASLLGKRLSGVILEDPYWLLPVSHVHDRETAQRQVEWLSDAKGCSEEERVRRHRLLWPGWAESEFAPWSRAITAVDIDVVRSGDYIPTRGWPDLLEDVHRAGVPVQIVTGTDRTGIRAEHQAIASALGAEVVILEGASHFVHLDQPRRFTDVTTSALDRMMRRSAASGAAPAGPQDISLT